MAENAPYQSPPYEEKSGAPAPAPAPAGAPGQSAPPVYIQQPAPVYGAPQGYGTAPGLSVLLFSLPIIFCFDLF